MWPSARDLCLLPKGAAYRTLVRSQPTYRRTMGPRAPDRAYLMEQGRSADLLLEARGFRPLDILYTRL
jgi:hypothetical protein